MESDDGDECAWLSSDFIPLLILPEIFHRRYDGRISEELVRIMLIGPVKTGLF